MCDYSIETVKTKKAWVAARLILTTFGQHDTKGFRDVEGPKDEAVCLCHGSRLVVQVTDRMKRDYALDSLIVAATFSQLEPSDSNPYVDGIIFDQWPGRHFSLQDFDLRVVATVEAIPGTPLFDGERAATLQPAPFVDA